MRRTSIIMVVIGMFMIIIGLLPAFILYPGMGGGLTWGSTSYLNFLIFQTDEHWVWQIGLLVVILGVILSRRGKGK
ncbi:hypothetical protein [Thermoactinomyces mirandus]|uniref:Uncharacterized protein n=1 Tax=Thermoactinomyces mirandus TaxID=2756294 RepID=A0A7W1XVF4_9BACL|nr:hypothetical protein [Thermoactinomyces mirandus]MBA4603928.1 hypothetical protein [Thermoactinomyces mirandus]